MAPRQHKSNEYAKQIRQLARLERANVAIIHQELAHVAEGQPQPSNERTPANSALDQEVVEPLPRPSNEQLSANSTLEQEGQVVEPQPRPSNGQPSANTTTDRP